MFDNMNKFSVDPEPGSLHHRRIASADSSSSLVPRRMKAPPMTLVVDDDASDGARSTTGTAGSSAGARPGSVPLDGASVGPGASATPDRLPQPGRRPASSDSEQAPGRKYVPLVDSDRTGGSPATDPGAGVGLGVGTGARDSKDVEPARGPTKSLLKTLHERRLHQQAVTAGVRRGCCRGLLESGLGWGW
jgi:hypothetical protein